MTMAWAGIIAVDTVSVATLGTYREGGANRIC